MSIWIIISIFFIKVVGGCINLYVHTHWFLTNDIEFYFTQSVKELTLMKLNPTAFFQDWLFNWGDSKGHLNLFKKENMTFWSSLGMLIHTKYMTLANILSLGHIYVDVIIYNVIYFIGQLSLFKCLFKFQPQKKYLFLVVVFFIPSVLFWTGGIHKDGLILSAIGMVTYFGMKYLETKHFKNLLLAIIFLILLFVTRYFYFLTILPPFLLWILFPNNKNKILIYLGTYFFALTLFFTIHFVLPQIEPLNLIQNRQLEFLSAKGYSDMATPLIEPNFISYIKNLPTALNHILLKPSFHFSDPLKYQLSAIDSLLVFIFIILGIIFIKRKNLENGFFLFLLFFSVSVYIFIGYTIPNAGALVRYKSEFTVLILSALVGLSEVPFLKRFYSK